MNDTSGFGNYRNMGINSNGEMKRKISEKDFTGKDGHIYHEVIYDDGEKVLSHISCWCFKKNRTKQHED
jgi:hypothetical protein